MTDTERNRHVTSIEDRAERDLAMLERVAGSSDAPRKSHISAAPDNAPRVELHCASNIVCQPIHWLWPGWLARGKLHILAGAPGTGKTTISLALAAAVSSGKKWPSGASAPVGNVLIWSGEDDAADTIVPRLKAADADLSRIYIIGDTRDGNDKRAFDPAVDLPALENEAKNIGNIALLIADPVVSAVAGDSHKNTEVRRALQPLVNLAARLDCAVLGITHFSKGGAGKDPTERVTGSIAFGALARVVMVTAKRSEGGEDGPGRLLARAKSNIGPDGGGYAYGLEQVEHDGLSASAVRWGASLDGSARDLLGEAEADDGADGSARDEARDWLADELANGPRPPKQLKAEATKAGISWRTVERAKSELGVKSEKTGFDGEWRWHVPKAGEDRQHRQEIERGNLGGLGGLGSNQTASGEGGDRHQSIACGACQHFRPDPLNPEAGIGRCEQSGKSAWRPIQVHSCTNYKRTGST